MFDTQAFLEQQFQSPRGLLAFLAAYGAETPNPAAVEKWFQRSTVPSQWLPVLLAYLEIDRGQPLSLTKYLGLKR